MLVNQITLLNETTLECLNETDEVKITKTFMKVGQDVLGADFGFVWLNSPSSNHLELVYKSPRLPFIPKTPREGGRNSNAIANSRPDFVTETLKTPDAEYVSKYIRSFVIIPLVYKNEAYGSMVFCFKKQEIFGREKRMLSSFIGNTVAQTITISRLILKEKEARILSEKQEAHFRSLVENINEIIFHIRQDGQIIYVSPSVEKVFGVKPEDVIGTNIKNVTYEEKGKKKNYLKKILKNKKGTSVTEFVFKNKKDGSLLYLESTSSNIAGKEKSFVMNVRNVTERKKLEQARETKRQLEEERFKVQSIADATHELRTPIAIIKGNVDLVLQTKDKNPKAPLVALRAIDLEVRHVSGILSDLSLITSKNEELKNRIIYSKVNIKSMVDKVVARFEVLAKKKNISLSARNIPQISIMGDKTYLERMLANLVKNSIIYGNENGCTNIVVKKKKDLLKIDIIDDGIGISKEDMPHVFERFYRADKSHSGDDNSTGLGLAVVKWAVEAHGGEVSVKKAPKKGTIFSVSLPIKG